MWHTLTGRRHKHPPRRRSPGATRQPLRVEALEERALPVCTILPPAAPPPVPPIHVTVNCTGTDDDTITLTRTGPPDVLTIQASGAPPRTFPCADVSAVTINAGPGNDRINLNDICPGRPVTAHGDDGDDTFVLTSGAFCIRDVRLHGGNGTDEVLYTDRLTQGQRTTEMKLPEGLLLCNGTPAVTVTGVESMTLTADNGPGAFEEVVIDSHLTSSSPTPCLQSALCMPAFLHIRGGLGTERLRFLNDPTGPLSGIRSLFEFARSGPTPRLVHTRLTPGPGQPLTTMTYTEIDSLELQSGAANDVFNIQSTVATTPVTINAGAGDDTFTVGNANNQLNDILGALTLHGQADADTFTVNDAALSNGWNYTVTGSSVTRAQAPAVSIGYFTVEGLVLTTSGGPDTVTVLATTVPTTVNAGGGNDTVNVGTPNTSLNPIQAPLTVHGNAGSNTLTLNDQTGGAGQFYYLTASTLDRFTAATISFGTVQTLRLNAGAGDDYLILGAQPPGTFVAFQAGGGNNFVLGPDTNNVWQVIGGNTGSLNTSLSFSAVQTLFGGAGSDTFHFVSNAALAGYLLGGGGVNSLSYADYIGGVTVNLSLLTATGVGVILFEIQNVTGSAFADILVGDNDANRLDGGPGRDLVIGSGWDYASFRPDVLLGGLDEDILIAGWTVHDFDPATLTALRNAWTQPTSYTLRVANLLAGVGAPALNETTVFSNQAASGNTLTGGTGLDFFFCNPLRDTTDRDLLNETLVPIF